MPIVVAIGGVLLLIVGSIVGRVLLALGLSYVTYKGVGVAIDWLTADIKTNLGSIGVEVGAFLSWLYVDRALSMVFSAYAVASLFKLASGQLTKMVFGGSGS